MSENAIVNTIQSLLGRRGGASKRLLEASQASINTGLVVGGSERSEAQLESRHSRRKRRVNQAAAVDQVHLVLAHGGRRRSSASNLLLEASGAGIGSLLEVGRSHGGKGKLHSRNGGCKGRVHEHGAVSLLNGGAVGGHSAGQGGDEGNCESHVEDNGGGFEGI